MLSEAYTKNPTGTIDACLQCNRSLLWTQHCLREEEIYTLSAVTEERQELICIRIFKYSKYYWQTLYVPKAVPGNFFRGV